MTLMDDPCADTTSHAVLLSHSTREDHLHVSVVIPLGENSDVAAILARLPALAGEVILVGNRPTSADLAAARAVRPDVRVAPETAGGDRAPLRAGFAAARADCIVVLDGERETNAHDIERFVAALHTGGRSDHRTLA
jgi:hypothetical protein